MNYELNVVTTWLLQPSSIILLFVILECQKVPPVIRASYTTKPNNGGGGGGGAAGSTSLTGLNLSLINKHDDLQDLNDLIRDYSDSSASEAPEQMVVNVNVPGMFRIAKNSGAGGRGGGRSNNKSPSAPQRNIQPPKNSPPTFSTQNLVSDFNQRSMQIRAYSQLVTAGLNSISNSSGNCSNSGNNRKRARLDNHVNVNNNNNNNNASTNNNNNNSLNNNNYYTIGAGGSSQKILIKPSHGVPEAKLPKLGGGGTIIPSITHALLLNSIYYNMLI